jgi:monoamine oxidase
MQLDSFADFLNRHCSELTPGERAQATAYVEGFNAADSRLISSRWLLEADRASGQGGEAGAFRILSGYDGILNDFLTGIRAGRAELRLSTVVSAIRWQTGRVELDLASRAGIPLPPVHARCAVVTVPLGVLRAAPNSTGAIQFIPDLPKKWAGSSALKMGSVVKLVLRFREPFWEETALGAFGFLHAPEEPFPTWWTTNPVRTTILTGWAGGPAADRLAGLSAEAILDHALNSLGRVLSLEPARLASIGDAWHVADWQIDPFARGAYSYVGVGGQQASRCLADAVEATLFFAGEATHDVLGGTVAGALASGYRAADEVLELDRDGKERILLA